MNEAELRKRFEQWMVAGSFGWIGRIPEDASTDKAGEYYGPAVQVAWMAWCEASRQCPAMEIISGTVPAFGLSEGNETERTSSDGNSAEVSGVGDCGDHGPQAFRGAGD